MFLKAVPVSTGTKSLARVPLRMQALSSSTEGSWLGLGLGLELGLGLGLGLG